MTTGDHATGHDRSDHHPHAHHPGAASDVDAERAARICEQVASAMTLWASPGLAVDDHAPHLGAVPTLVISTNIGAYSRDEHPGAEYIDLVLSAMLGAGFGLALDTAPAALLELPTPAGWSARLDSTSAALTVSGPDGALYDGTIGPTPPTGWAGEVARRGCLAVLVASSTNLTADHRAHRIVDARRAGKVVGALVPAQSVPPHR